ncbi:MAG TPA: BON domain-containing protein [Usitatibacter sp.]|nr:BON domain-containing protein [Usitatibacter sp.]
MRIAHCFALAAALAMGAPAAFAHDGARHAWSHWWHYNDRTKAADDNNIHAGGVTYDDDVLANRVADALRADRTLSEPGVTATVTAKDGRVSLTGSADSIVQATRAEQIARSVAGAGNVSGTLETTAG